MTENSVEQENSETQAETEAGDSPIKLIRDIIMILAVVMAIHTVIAKPFYIPSPSMMPILRNGDRLVVSKWPYGWSFASVSFHLAPRFKGRLFGSTPEQGDIVVLEHPTKRIDYIKRVIGLPGDIVEMRRGELVLNGKAVKREQQPSLAIAVDANLPDDTSGFSGRIRTDENGKRWFDAPIIRETLPNGVRIDTIDLGPDQPNDSFGPYEVQPGHVFLMGDNRDNSADSRVSIEGNGFGGAVPLEVISGRAEIITFSTDGTAQWYNPISWFTALRSGRAGTNLQAVRK